MEKDCMTEPERFWLPSPNWAIVMVSLGVLFVLVVAAFHSIFIGAPNVDVNCPFMATVPMGKVSAVMEFAVVGLSHVIETLPLKVVVGDENSISPDIVLGSSLTLSAPEDVSGMETRDIFMLASWMRVLAVVIVMVHSISRSVCAIVIFAFSITIDICVSMTC